MSTFDNITKSNAIAGLNKINKKLFELTITCKTSMIRTKNKKFHIITIFIKYI